MLLVESDERHECCSQREVGLRVGGQMKDAPVDAVDLRMAYELASRGEEDD